MEMEEIGRFMETYNGSDMSPIPPSETDGGKEHVEVFHDETAFHSNDFQQDYWVKAGQQVLKKKDRGRLIMASGFICQRFGNLALTAEHIRENNAMPEAQHLVVTDSSVIIYPTSKAGGDEYWNMDQMIAQVSELFSSD